MLKLDVILVCTFSLLTPWSRVLLEKLASQEIPHILWNPRFITTFTSAHHLSLSWPRSFQSMPSPIPLPEYPYKCYLPIYVRVFKAGSFPQVSPPKPLLSPVRVTCPAKLILLDLISQIIFDEEYRSLRPSWCSFLHSRVTSSLWGQSILLSTLFSNTLSLRSFLSVSDHVSQPYKAKGRIIVLCIWGFMFLGSRLEDKRFCTKWSKQSMTAICS